MVVVLAIWLAAAAGIMIAFHAMVQRRRREDHTPVEVRDFLKDLRAELHDNHPDAVFRGLIPGRFAAVISIQGQELPISLHELYQRHLAFPTAFSRLVSEFVAEATTRGLEQASEHALADVATRILPQVRTSSWLRERGSVFGAGALAHRELTDDLVVCYVIDDPWCMTFVCRAHLGQWGMSEEDLYHLATRNLHGRANNDLPTPETEGAPVLLKTGDGFDAARVLLLDREHADGWLVGIPERDALWLGAGEDQDLDALTSLNEQQSTQAEHPLSPQLFRVTDGELVPLSAADSAR